MQPKLNFSVANLVWYFTGAAIFLGGLVYIGLLSEHYRYSSDDWYGLHLNSTGIPGVSYVAKGYFTREGAVLQGWLQGVTFWFQSQGVPFWVVLSTVYSALVYSNYYLLSGISKIRGLQKRPEGLAFFASAVFSVALILNSPSIEETWFWATGSAYQYPLIMFGLWIGFHLRGKYTLSMVPMAFFAFSRITYSATVFGIALIIGAFVWFKKGTISKEYIRIAAVYLLVLIIYVVAPGNWVRRANESAIESAALGIADFIPQIKAFLTSVVYPLRMALLGMATSLALSAYGLTLSLNRVWFYLPILGYTFFVITHAFLFLFATGQYGYPRVYAFHAYLLNIIIVFYSLWFADRLRGSSWFKKQPFMLGGASIAFGILFMCRLFVGFPDKLRRVSQFSTEYDNRYEMLVNSQAYTLDTVWVDRVSHPGVLYYHEFMEPGYYTNMTFEMAHELPFKVGVKKQEETEGQSNHKNGNGNPIQ